MTADCQDLVVVGEEGVNAARGCTDVTGVDEEIRRLRSDPDE
jgi:hypothetical protein